MWKNMVEPDRQIRQIQKNYDYISIPYFMGEIISILASGCGG
jgi:hypothetical protein